MNFNTLVVSAALTVFGIGMLGGAGCSSTPAGGDGGVGTEAGTNGEAGADASSPGKVDTKNFCDQWAVVCPKDAAREADAVATCKTNCEQGQLMTTEQCAFSACSVETGKCDNVEKGDPSVGACIKAHGWYKGADAGSSPCTRSEGLDSSCASQGKPGKAYLCGSPGLTPGITGCVNGATNGVANGTFCCP